MEHFKVGVLNKKTKTPVFIAYQVNDELEVVVGGKAVVSQSITELGEMIESETGSEWSVSNVRKSDNVPPQPLRRDEFKNLLNSLNTHA